MDLYFETSALSRYYHFEHGSDQVLALVDDPANRTVVSWLTFVEIQSAFAQKCRTGSIDESDYRAFQNRLLADISQGRWKLMRVLRNHHDEAIRLIAKYGKHRLLRSPDALHLGVFVGLHKKGHAEKMVTTDGVISDLAQGEGLPVINALLT